MSTAAALESPLPARVHHLRAAGIAALAVVLVAGLPEVLGDLGRLAAVLVLQLGFALAWVLVTGVQGFAGALTVGTAAAVAADLVLVLTTDPTLGGLLGVFGIGFIAVVVQQMFRRRRDGLVLSLSGVVLLVVVIGALAALLLLGDVSAGGGWAAITVLAVGAALVVGHLVDLVLPRPQVAHDVPRGLVGLVLAVVSAAAVALLGRGVADARDALTAAVGGAILGVVTALMALVASYLVVETTAPGAAEARRPDAETGEAEPRFSPWALPVIQVVFPIAACAPAALALHSVL